MDFSDLVAKKIRELMKEKNINSNKLSKLTGIYRSTLTMFLTRKNRTIRLENLLYICEAFDMKLSEFFSDERFDEAEANEWRIKKEN
ncbi:MAG: helix-turn-helix transcriptional regulator [Clostridia bacterium]|nr:helix-turn-helix transcriptional regulator [Clostridia bacterium]